MKLLRIWATLASAFLPSRRPVSSVSATILAMDCITGFWNSLTPNVPCVTADTSVIRWRSRSLFAIKNMLSSPRMSSIALLVDWALSLLLSAVLISPVRLFLASRSPSILDCSSMNFSPCGSSSPCRRSMLSSAVSIPSTSLSTLLARLSTAFSSDVRFFLVRMFGLIFSSASTVSLA